MKKILIIIIITCWPLILAAQNGVTLSSLAMDAGTVTFDVSWKTPMPTTVWSDTVWVFVDYNAAGAMKRLPLVSGATLIATSAPGVGKVIEVPGNTNGVWVVGNARSAGHFSATVKLLTSLTDASGVCAYASNRRPEGKYNSTANVSLTGVPMYTIVLKHTDGTIFTTQSSSPYLTPASYTLVSFTDATGAPGVFGCRPMEGDIDFSIPANITKNQKTSFMITTQPSVINASVTYSWSAPGFTPDTYTGTTFSTVSPGIGGIYPVTLTAQAAGYCDLTKTKDVTMNNCINPVVQTLSASASGFCVGSEGVIFTLDGTEKGAQYQLYKNGVAAGTVLNGTGSAATFTGKFDTEGTYTAKVIDNGMYCAGLVDGTREVTANPLPKIPNIAQPVDVCQHNGDIVFTADGYSGTLTWTSNGGGTENGNTVTFSSDAVGKKTVVARSEQVYQGAPTCYSSTVTRSAMVNALPVISLHPKSQVFCEPVITATLTVTATQDNGSTLTYQWKKGTGAGSNEGTDSNTYTSTISAVSDYWVVVTDSNSCAATSNKATVTVSGYTGGEIGTGTVCDGGPGKIGR